MHLGIVTMARAGSRKTTAPAPMPAPIYRAPTIIPHSTATHLQRQVNGSASVIDALTAAPDTGTGNSPPISYETVSQGAITGGGAGGGGTIVTVPEKKSGTVPIALALAALYFLG